jgi:hypothetical protein
LGLDQNRLVVAKSVAVGKMTGLRLQSNERQEPTGQRNRISEHIDFFIPRIEGLAIKTQRYGV